MANVNPVLLPHERPSEEACGDGPLWGSWTALAWRQLADLQGEYQRLTPRFREVAAQSARDDDADFNDFLRFAGSWSTLAQLAMFGLGWRFPAFGLHRWVQQGQPTEHPILNLINDWWGDDVRQLVAWAAYPRSGTVFMHEHDNPHSHGASGPVIPRYEDVERDPVWRRVWIEGGYDALHLDFHANMPVSVSEDGYQLALAVEGKLPRATVLVDNYCGWYAALRRAGESLPERQRSWRVDVVVRSLGWMGEYRRSQQSGLWFTGRHRWHALGLM